MDLPRFRNIVDHLAWLGDAERGLLRLVCWLDAGLYIVGWWEEKTELFEAALRIDGPPSAMRARAHLFRSRPGPLHLIDTTHAERAEAMADMLSEKGRWSCTPGCWSSLAKLVVGTYPRGHRPGGDGGGGVRWPRARPSSAVRPASSSGSRSSSTGNPTQGLEIQRDALRDRCGAIFPNAFHIAHNLSYLGHCHRYLGDDTAALVDWTEAREIRRRVGNRGTAIHVNIGLADLAVDLVATRKPRCGLVCGGAGADQRERCVDVHAVGVDRRHAGARGG